MTLNVIVGAHIVTNIMTCHWFKPPLCGSEFLATRARLNRTKTSCSAAFGNSTRKVILNLMITSSTSIYIASSNGYLCPKTRINFSCAAMWRGYFALTLPILPYYRRNVRVWLPGRFFILVSRLLNRQDKYISYHPWVVIIARSIRFTICLLSNRPNRTVLALYQLRSVRIVLESCNSQYSYLVEFLS